MDGADEMRQRCDVCGVIVVFKFVKEVSVIEEGDVDGKKSK